MMQWLMIIGVTFSTVFVAELGDKSQLITISLASKYDDKKKVLSGLILGTTAVTMISVALGSLVYNFVNITAIKIIASLIFIFFGALSLLKNKRKSSSFEEKKKGAFISPFVLSILAEFGDKTQLAVIALTARYSSPITVFVGAVMGLALITIMGVLVGSTLSKFFKSNKLDIFVGILFIIIGFGFLTEALFL